MKKTNVEKMVEGLQSHIDLEVNRVDDEVAGLRAELGDLWLRVAVPIMIIFIAGLVVMTIGLGVKLDGMEKSLGYAKENIQNLADYNNQRAREIQSLSARLCRIEPTPTPSPECRPCPCNWGTVLRWTVSGWDGTSALCETPDGVRYWVRP